MFTAGRLTVLSAAIVATGALIFGVAASGASAPWPSCLGEPATIVGTDGNDTLNGTSGDDVIVGLGGDDVITSGANDEMDLICGGDGNDSLIVTSGGLYSDVSGDAGDDRIQGAKDSFVQVDYEHSPASVNVDLGAGTATGWGNDTLVRVDFAYGSAFDDVLKGSAGLNVLWGDAGNDTLLGLGGLDDLDGGPGNDTLDGGTGHDWLDYDDAPAGVNVRLAKGTATGGAGVDTFRSMEVVYGSKHADTIFGGNSADGLQGSDGNDRLYGGLGKDTLLGGRGNDSLYGGLGNDALRGEKGNDRADGGPARDVCVAEHKVHCP